MVIFIHDLETDLLSSYILTTQQIWKYFAVSKTRSTVLRRIRVSLVILEQKIQRLQNSNGQNRTKFYIGIQLVII